LGRQGPTEVNSYRQDLYRQDALLSPIQQHQITEEYNTCTKCCYVKFPTCVFDCRWSCELFD